MELKIISDSACDLPEQLTSKYEIDILPFLVYIDDDEFLDGQTIQPSDVYAAMRAGKVPTSAQVPLDLIIATFTKYAQENQPCLYIGFSSKLSGTCNTIRLVTAEIKENYPDWEITIIDSFSGCLAQGLIVLEAAQMNKAGVAAQDIIHRVKSRSQNNVEHIFSVDDLNYLYRGGRVSYASAFLGGILSVKPILHVQDGLMIPFQKVRGTKNTIKRICELVQERSLGHPDQLIAISHADDPSKAAELETLLRTELGYKNFLTNVVGCVLGCHIGLGGVAAFFVNSQVKVPNSPTGL